MEDFFTSIEFYVVAIATGILLFGFILNPSNKGEAYTYFFKGFKYPSVQKTETPQLIISGTEEGSLKIMHTGVELSNEAQISLVVEVRGSDIKITEKIEDNQFSPIEENEVVYFVTCLRNQRYHLYFESTHTGMWASSSFFNNVDYHTTVDFKY